MSQDNFSIVDQISQSPTATVYKAYQKALERVVLLKVLHKHLLRDRSLVARFSREARSCAMLRSENIVQVYDLTEIDGAPAIVMEYVEGKSLEELIQDPRSRSEELLIDVAVAVLKALSYSHERGIIHRDIKPSNILVSETGAIKVTDFGLAAVADAPVLTMEGSLIGTPAYMSPEQARGEQVDSRSDLFSLGVTLVEVLTGEKVLLGDSYAECMKKIQTFDLNSLDSLREKCSQNVFEFLKKLLAPVKEQRFSSSDEALEYLSSFLGHDRVGLASRKAKHKWKSFAAIGSAAALGILIVVVLVAKYPFGENLMRMTSSSVDTNGVTTYNRDTTSSRLASNPESQTRDRNSNRISEMQVASDPHTKSNVPASSGLMAASRTQTFVDSGFIAIGNCQPWAKIYIDSAYAGQTPLGGSMKVSVGKHKVTFSNPYFTPIVKTVDVQKKFLSTVEADFLRDAGYLYVTVDPGGNVFVDDNFREATPSANPIPVSAGTRIVRVQNPNFSDLVRSVTVKPGDTLRLRFSFISPGQK